MPHSICLLITKENYAKVENGALQNCNGIMCMKVDASPCVDAMGLVAHLGNGQHHQRDNKGH